MNQVVAEGAPSNTHNMPSNLHINPPVNTQYEESHFDVVGVSVVVVGTWFVVA